MDMNKLFKFYWKKEKQTLIWQLRLFCCLFFFFSLSLIFLFFINVKDGRTPLYIAACEGHEQIVQILLEKGKANVDLADEVILLIVSLFLFLFSKDFEEVVKILSEHGSNIHLQTNVFIFSLFFHISFFSFFMSLDRDGDGFVFLFCFSFLTFLFIYFRMAGPPSFCCF